MIIAHKTILWKSFAASQSNNQTILCPKLVKIFFSGFIYTCIIFCLGFSWCIHQPFFNLKLTKDYTNTVSNHKIKGFNKI